MRTYQMISLNKLLKMHEELFIPLWREGEALPIALFFFFFP